MAIEIRATKTYTPGPPPSTTVDVVKPVANGFARIPTVTGVISPGQQIFKGDFSTGNFLQWYQVQNANIGGTDAVLSANYIPNYGATIVNDAVKGKACRLELRSGDTCQFDQAWAGFTVERSDLSQDPTVLHEGETVWVKFSIKFDPAFPTNLGTRGIWVSFVSFHQMGDGAGQVLFACEPGSGNNTWGISTHVFSAPGNEIDLYAVWTTTIVRNVWQDIVYKVLLGSALSGPGAGTLEVWLNGVKQTMTPEGGGGQMYVGQTIVPTLDCFPKIGLYRKSTAETHVISYSGYVIATTEAALYI